MGEGQKTEVIFNLLEKQMERALHDINHAEKILQITSDTLILVDKCGMCVDINTHSDLWFLQEDKILGKNLFELLPVHTLQKLLPEFQKVIDEQAVSNKNYKLIIGDETYYFKCIMHPFEGMVLCQYRDITARNNVKLQLERTNYELKEIQKAAQIGQWKYSTSKKIMYYHGYTDILCTEDIKEIKLDDYLTYILAEDRSTFKEWLAKNEKQFTTDTIEYRLSMAGIVYYIRLQSYFREVQPDGDILIEGYIQNITDRMRYESEIKRLNQIMDTTMKNIPAGIVVKDVENDFRYVYRNRESYSRELRSGNVIGVTDFDYYPQEIAMQKRKEDMEIAATKKGMHWITEKKDKNGQLIILDKQKIMVESEDFSPIIVSIEWDITQLELMKRELMIAKEKAETSDKLKSAFLANMSHEIRTPLNAIVGFSRIIAESDDTEERHEYYEIVEANNERLLQLINEILDLSKIESGIVDFTIGTVNLNRLCKDIYDAHVFRCPQGVQLIPEPSDEELTIESDNNRLFQVFSNLIGNAFKFTSQGSIRYGFIREDDVVKFHVTDTGIGIEAEKLPKVFERFAKLNTFAQGTGLGMSICKTILERLGGTISVTSEFGKGTSFTFTLPYNTGESTTESISMPEEQAQESGHALPQPAATKAKNEITILIAEDTDSNYDLLKAILGKTYKLVRAHDGMEAVTMFDEIKPDLILMDIKMPNLDGLEATKIIRQLSQDVPIIAQSAYAYDHDRKSAEEAGCNDFLSKPISQTKLKDMITKWLNL